MTWSERSAFLVPVFPSFQMLLCLHLRGSCHLLRVANSLRVCFQLVGVIVVAGNRIEHRLLVGAQAKEHTHRFDIRYIAVRVPVEILNWIGNCVLVCGSLHKSIFVGRWRGFVFLTIHVVLIDSTLWWGLWSSSGCFCCCESSIIWLGYSWAISWVWSVAHFFDSRLVSWWNGSFLWSRSLKRRLFFYWIFCRYYFKWN